MVYVRSRERKTGTFHTVVLGRHQKAVPCGKGEEAFDYAQELAVEIRRQRRAAKAGRPLPVLCAWTLANLRPVHLEDARRRGLSTALPQRHGRQSKLDSAWNVIEDYFGDDLFLDRITPAGIREFVGFLEKTPGKRRTTGRGPSAINGVVFFVLRPALEIARERAESGFTGDPFAGLKPLAARRKRDPMILSSEALDAVVRACYARHRPLGAHVAMLRETASRLNEEPQVRPDGVLRYPPQKRGTERFFDLTPKLLRLVRARRAFSRPVWREAVAAAGLPDLNPHDLRHSVLTELGHRPGMSLARLQNYGGWKSPAMAAKYLHGRGEALQAATECRPDVQARGVPRGTRRRARSP